MGEVVQAQHADAVLKEFEIQAAQVGEFKPVVVVDQAHQQHAGDEALPAPGWPMNSKKGKDTCCSPICCTK